MGKEKEEKREAKPFISPHPSSETVNSSPLQFGVWPASYTFLLGFFIPTHNLCCGISGSLNETRLRACSLDILCNWVFLSKPSTLLPIVHFIQSLALDSLKSGLSHFAQGFQQGPLSGLAVAIASTPWCDGVASHQAWNRPQVKLQVILLPTRSSNEQWWYLPKFCVCAVSQHRAPSKPFVLTVVSFLLF